MTERKDILDGLDTTNWTKRFGLIYTCNAGWIDLGHLNPHSARPEIGAANLWRQVAAEGAPMLDARCVPLPPSLPPHLRLQQARNQPDHCPDDPLYRFEDNKTGYPVRFREDHAGIPGRPGREGRYVVKHGLSLDEKRSVALAIFMEVSIKFENLQRIAGFFGVTQSGYSQEDLVSNLIGFYIAVGDLSQYEAIRLCHPVSATTAYAIWDNEGAPGRNKNTTFSPKLARQTCVGPEKKCTDECAGQPRKLPAVFTRITPATKGRLFRDRPLPL